MDTTMDNQGFAKRSGIKPPSKIKLESTSPRALSELPPSGMNARIAMPTAATKHKPSGCKIPVPTQCELDRPLTPPVPEPAAKRKTLAEMGGEPYKSKTAAPPSSRPVSNSVKSTVARGMSASMSRATGNTASRMVSTSAFASSMGSGARAPVTTARPKSAYGHNRSRSNHQSSRPATAMAKRNQYDDEEEADPKVFYDERIEAIEDQFREFTAKMERDVQQAADNKMAAQQLQGRVAELEAIRTQLETSNRNLETDLKDAQSCLSTAKMELEMTRRNHTFEADDLRRRLRNEAEELEFQQRKELDKMKREREESEEKIIKGFKAQIEELLKEHREKLAELQKQIDADSEAERNRRTREAQELDAEWSSKLRAATLETEAKQRELQLVQGELINVKAELDSTKQLKAGLQTQLGLATTNNLTLEAENQAMKEKIKFLESDSQAQSQSFNDLHKRMQDAIEAADRANDKLRQEETLRRKLFNQVQELKGNIRVMCRVRPKHDLETDPAKISFPDVDTDSKEVALLGPEKISATGKDITPSYAYSFDRVFGPTSQNGEVFEEISQLVQSALDGYNVCIFCYGQTGAGKTFTMSSADGMIPRATAQIYAEAKRLEEKGWRYNMEGSFIEVYNETYNDLLGRAEDLDKKKVEVRHDAAKKQTILENTVSVALDSPRRVEEILDRADKNRTVAATKANMRSSRSHSVFILKLVGTNEITGERSEGTLNLVDLAGSERLEHSKAEGARLKETQNINKSLSCLGDVINALGSAKEGTHIPYRNSKLTYLLQYSLGGNSKTLMFVMVSPLQAHLQETITSLKFATKVHNTHIGTAKKQTKSIKDEKAKV